MVGGLVGETGGDGALHVGGEEVGRAFGEGVVEAEDVVCVGDGVCAAERGGWVSWSWGERGGGRTDSWDRVDWLVGEARFALLLMTAE